MKQRILCMFLLFALFLSSCTQSTPDQLDATLEQTDLAASQTKTEEGEQRT